MSKKPGDRWAKWDDFYVDNAYVRTPPRLTPAVQLSRNVQLETNPHYTDDRFSEPQTVFGAEVKGLSYDYSDRLWQWDSKKAEAATEIAKQSGHVIRSANWYQVYLSAYFGYEVELVHVVAGVNRSNGYPYAVFGYRQKVAPEATDG